MTQLAVRLGCTRQGAHHIVRKLGLGERVANRLVLSEVDTDALVLHRNLGASLETCRLIVLRDLADKLAARVENL